MVIGITGSFGSGKSTVAGMFARHGAHVIDADKVNRSLMTPSKKLYRALVKRFGRDILKKDKTIDRKKLARLVFKKKREMASLRRIAHPEIIKEIERIIRSKKKNKVIIVDAPLLIESGFYKKADRVIVVRTRMDLQFRRLIRARGMAGKEILERIGTQAPLKKKLALADFVIDNSGSRRKTLYQVQRIWKTIRGER